MIRMIDTGVFDALDPHEAIGPPLNAIARKHGVVEARRVSRSILTREGHDDLTDSVERDFDFECSRLDLRTRDHDLCHKLYYGDPAMVTS